MAGFGRSPFGRGPFGRSDLGRDLLIESFPVEYFDESIQLDAGETRRQNDKDPLLKLLNVYRNSLNKRRIEIDKLPFLIDYENAPLEIVQLWGQMLGLGIDKNDPEFLQRSFLGNASQWLQLKGSGRGYEVRGLASGFTVELGNFWRVNPIYELLIPARNRFYLKPKGADAGADLILHTDSAPGTFVGTPTEEGPDYAKSSYLQVTFEVAEPRRAGVDYNFLLNLIIDKVKDVVAIHHEIYRLIFQIRMNVAVSTSAEIIRIDEHSILNFMVQGIYDIEAADVHPTDDGHLTVTIPELGTISEYDASLSLSATIDPIEEITDIPLSLNVQAVAQLIEEYAELDISQLVDVEISVGDIITIDINAAPAVSFLIDEFTQDINAGSAPVAVMVPNTTFYFNAYAANYFDVVPGDELPVDTAPLTITWQTIVGP